MRNREKLVEIPALRCALLLMAGCLWAFPGQPLASGEDEPARNRPAKADAGGPQQAPLRFKPGRAKKRVRSAIPPQAEPRIRLSFMVDPRLTRSLYMGERWVSPMTYTSVTSRIGESITVNARTRVVDARGYEISASPTWTPADPAMVTVDPPRGNEVELTVRGEGESTLTVSHGGLSRTLVLKTVRQERGWRVDISPSPGTTVLADESETGRVPTPRRGVSMKTQRRGERGD